MRILMVHDLLAGTGGAERYLREISAALAEQGWEPAFLTAPGQSPAWVQAPMYTLSPSMGLRSGRRTLAELEHVLDRLKPDLIYMHNLKDLRTREIRSRVLLPLLLKVLAERAPSVLFVHDIRLICPNETKHVRATGTPCTEPMGLACLRGECCRQEDESWAEAWSKTAIVRWHLGVCRDIGRLIAPSRYIAEELVRNGVRPERMVVLPYFTERRPAGPTVSPTADLLWVGRFGIDRTKGFEPFADLLTHLRDLPWRATVVGDGVLLPEARALVDRLGLTSRISFVGRLSDGELDAWYARSRVVVVTSMVAESFCMVGIEAMAHGRPVVAFDVGGIREWLEDGVTGFAVSRGDSRALAAAVRRLLTEPGLAKRFGEAGRELVDHRFRRATHVAGLLATLEAARDAWAETTRVRELRHFRRAMSAIS